MTHQIIPAKDIDYSNADEICAYQMLLCKIYERAGGFDLPAVSNSETIAVRREGLVWLREVERVMESIITPSSPVPTSSPVPLNLGDIPALLEAYDFFYRVCHRESCPSYIRKIRTAAADRFAKGDRSISRARVALMLSKEMNRDIRTLDRRYAAFAGSMTEKWVNDLERYGRLRGETLGGPREIQLRDAYDILAHLLQADLFAYLPDSSSKLHWIRAYTLTEQQLQDLDAKTRLAYIAFDQAAAAMTGVPLPDRDRSYARHFRALTHIPSLHPLLRAAIALDLSAA